MAGTLLFFLGLAVLARGAVVPAVPATAAAAVPLAKLEEFDPAPQYSFAYDVQDAVTGDSKAQYETRNGDIVRGSYSLIEADGTRRIVEYTADPINGFNAIVSREPAIAAPVVPLRPAALTPVAIPAAPAAAAPAPSIPAVGPDSDVEVLDTRLGPLKAKPTARDRELQRQQLQQLQRLQEQQQQQLLQEQQSRSSRLQIQYHQQQEQQQQQQQQQQQKQQQEQQSARIITGQIERQQQIATPRLIGLPAAARAIATYPANPYAAYSAAYSSPFAYAVPLNGLAYTPATA